MENNIHSPYNILDADIICEHKMARIDPAEAITLHNHDGYEVVFFLGGDASILVESEEKKLERGDMILIPPYIVHGVRIVEVEKYERIVLNFRPHILNEIEDEETDLASYFHSEANRKFSLLSVSAARVPEIIDLMDRLEASLHQKQIGQNILSKALLAEFMVFVANYTQRHTVPEYDNIMMPTVKKIFDYIDQNATSELTVESIAESLHHNSDYLGHIFKVTTGGSLKYYINAKKIAMAQQLLREGNPPVDVCFMLGFSNYSSFSRCFSKHVGRSPKQYIMWLRQ